MILVVDDFIDMRKSLVQILTNLGYRDVVEAHDGNSALKMMRQLSEAGLLQAVICDLHSPNGLNGFELFKASKLDEKLRAIPFYLLGEKKDIGSLQGFLKSGIKNFLIKPFDMSSVKVCLQDIANISIEKVG